MSAKILVVEDEPSIQTLIALNLRRSGYEVEVVGSVAQATESTRAQLPDLVLLDWMLPGASGVDFARRLRSESRTASLPIIMLTAKAEETDKVSGLESGADDYLCKPFSMKELQARIKALLRRSAPQTTDQVVAIDGLSLDPAAHLITANGNTVLEMGPTEFRLLHYFMTHPDKVHSRSRLLDQVWGDHVFIEERTIDVHIRRLRKALEPVGFEYLIDTVRGSGYRLSGKATAVSR